MKVNRHREMLDHLSDALVEDILNASDEEILSEVAEECGPPKAVANHVREIFASAQRQAAKALLIAAREAIDQQKKGEGGRVKVVMLDPVRARRALTKVLDQHPDSAEALTLAARKGTDLSDADVLSMLEDLQELGLYAPDLDPEKGQ